MARSVDKRRTWYGTEDHEGARSTPAVVTDSASLLAVGQSSIWKVERAFQFSFLRITRVCLLRISGSIRAEGRGPEVVDFERHGLRANHLEHKQPHSFTATRTLIPTRHLALGLLLRCSTIWATTCLAKRWRWPRGILDRLIKFLARREPCRISPRPLHRGDPFRAVRLVEPRQDFPVFPPPAVPLIALGARSGPVNSIGP
jgi:hypothetical protein